MQEKWSGSFESDTLWAAYYLLKKNTGRSSNFKITTEKVTDIHNAIDAYRRHLSRMKITKTDADEVLTEAMSLSEEEAKKTLLWIDPPYLWTAGYKYGSKYERPEGLHELMVKLSLLNKKGVHFVFFNSDPASVFPRVIGNWENYVALDLLLKDINAISEQPSITTLRMIEPAGVKQQKFPRKEMIITNLPTAKFRTKHIKELPWKSIGDYIRMTPVGIEAIKKELKGVPIEDLSLAKQRQMFHINAMRMGWTKKDAGDFLKKYMGRRHISELSRKEAHQMLLLMPKPFLKKEMRAKAEELFSVFVQKPACYEFVTDALGIKEQDMTEPQQKDVLSKLAQIAQNPIQGDRIRQLVAPEPTFATQSLKTEYDDIQKSRARHRMKVMAKNKGNSSNLHYALRLSLFQHYLDVRYLFENWEEMSGIQFYNKHYWKIILASDVKDREKERILKELTTRLPEPLTRDEQNNVADYFQKKYLEKNRRKKL